MLRLRPDIDRASFEGDVTIHVTAHEPIEQVELHSLDLALTSLTVAADGRRRPCDFALDDESERLVIGLDEPLEPGEATIEATFTGVLNDQLRGFYRSTYEDDDGVEHAIATTQFEATNARRCFPCWDEPDRKAVFEVTLDVPPGMLAVSAQREVSRAELGDGHTRIAFGPTPEMSSYLLAFVVGQLEASDPVDVDGVPLRLVHRPGRADLVPFGLDAAVFCLRWLTDYFGVPYFGDKIDLLAIPDFAFGAMENTGCVTFREALLLIDPDTTTQPEQQTAVAVIAHELAHMWFGNLVTMRWWEGLWLKEAFATFMENSATAAYRPDWRVWESFALDRSAAYAVDALHSTRPIEYDVESPADAEGMYDVLTYEKGAAVVRMLEQFVGPERFRDGIRTYMRSHSFGNTVTNDLWQAIESATGHPVGEIMRNWIYAGGFPVIDASLGDGRVELAQRPFRLLERTGADEPLWHVPVAVQIGDDRLSVLMDPRGAVPVDDPDATVIVDPDNHGFFRVRYDGVLAARLAERLMTLTPGQRYTLFDDLFDLVLAGQSSVADFVRLARAIDGESSPPVWTRVASAFSTFAHVAPDRRVRGLVADLWTPVARPQLDVFGYERAHAEADPLLNEARAALYTTLGSLSRDPSVIEHARSVFDGSVETKNPSMDAAAVRVVASTGSREDYDEMFERFRDASSPQVERRYLFALARFDDRGAIDDLCARTIDGSIRNQDSGLVLGLALGNRWHGESVWDFVTANWETITDLVPDSHMGRLVGGAQWLEHGDVHLDVEAFMADHPVPQARLAVAQHLERLKVHVALRRRIVDELAAVSGA